MSAAAPLQNLAAKPQSLSNSTHAGLLLQMKCSCGSPTASLTGECAGCKSKKRLHTKLTIGASNDPLEKEADRVASQVLASPADQTVSVTPPQIQRFTEHATDETDAIPCSVERVLASPGRLLDPVLQRDMEQRFGHDLSRVRVHSDGTAEQSTGDVNARAYTVGQHIVFAPGLYAPATPQGRQLIAHELVHTLQQRGAARQLQRRSEPGASGTGDSERSVDSSAVSSPGSTPEAFLQPGWSDVHELGIAYKEGPQNVGGANLRATPGGAFIEWLPHDTKVFVLKEHATQKAYAVTTIGKSGAFGYVSSLLIKLHLPDPESRIVKVKPGDTSLGLARQHYATQGFNDAWYADQRYVVNALYWANTHQKHKSAGRPSIEKKDTWVDMPPFGKVFVKADSDDAPWQTVQVNAGRLLWLPGVDFLRSLYSVVRSKGGGTGSIKAEIWQTVKGIYNKAAYAIAFIAGVIHGFVKSIWDAIAGIADLLYSAFKSLLSGELISDVKDLAASVRRLTWEGIKEALGNWADEWSRKLDDPSPWTSGRAHGYLTGYVMAEAAMLLLTGGALATFKGAIWGSRLGKAVKGSRAFQTLEKGVLKAGQAGRAADVGFQKAVQALDKTRYGKAAVKGAKAMAKAVVWTRKGVARALSLPPQIAAELTEAVIAKLRSLKEHFSRIKKFGGREKKWLFGCQSPCKWDPDFIEEAMKLTDDEIEDFVGKIDKMAETAKVKGGKIEDRRVPKRKVRRMEAEDIPRATKTETLEQAKARIQTVIGKTIADDPTLRKLWDEAASEVMEGKSLTKKNAATMYDRTRNKFWQKVRGTPNRFRDAGFALPRNSKRAPYLRGMRKKIRAAEFKISLDHSAEKAIGSNWKRALDPTNLVYEFAAPNSWREIIQMRHPVLRP